jgi:hypothetical protein
MIRDTPELLTRAIALIMSGYDPMFPMRPVPLLSVLCMVLILSSFVTTWLRCFGYNSVLLFNWSPRNSANQHKWEPLDGGVCRCSGRNGLDGRSMATTSALSTSQKSATTPQKGRPGMPCPCFAPRTLLAVAASYQ